METLDDIAIAHIANYFQALAEPMRLKVLNALRSGERNVGELAELLDCTTANISKHLSLLAKGLRQPGSARQCGVLPDRRSGDLDLCNLVCGQVGKRLAAQAEIAAKLVSDSGQGLMNIRVLERAI